MSPTTPALQQHPCLIPNRIASNPSFQTKIGLPDHSGRPLKLTKTISLSAEYLHLANTEDGVVTKLFLNPEELVILCNPVGTAH